MGARGMREGKRDGGGGGREIGGGEEGWGPGGRGKRAGGKRDGGGEEEGWGLEMGGGIGRPIKGYEGGSLSLKKREIVNEKRSRLVLLKRDQKRERGRQGHKEGDLTGLDRGN